MGEKKTFGGCMKEIYDIDGKYNLYTKFFPTGFFKVGMVLLYTKDMATHVVGTINIVTNIGGKHITTRRLNQDGQCHESGGFDTPIEKNKLIILKS